MNEITFDTSQLKLPDTDKIRDVFRSVRTELLAEAGDELHRAVTTSFSGSGIQTRTGKVLSWQQKHVKKGYAAVRPQDRPTGKDGPGAITNYLESGHRIRRPSGKGKRPYRPRINKARVPGFRFYKTAAVQAEKLAEDLGQRMAEQIAARLEEL